MHTRRRPTSTHRGVEGSAHEAECESERNTFQELGDGLGYGLGVVRFNRWVGHGGEALGLETVALKDSQSGTIIALGATSCGAFLSFAKIMGALYPDAPLFG